MKTKQSISKADLKLLVDISCMNKAEMPIFEQFHKMIIALTYEATDIEIDYKRKRIHLNIAGEEKKGDYLYQYDDLTIYRMSVNLSFKDFSSFLKNCIRDTETILNQYSCLKNSFFKGRISSFKSSMVLEEF